MLVRTAMSAPNICAAAAAGAFGSGSKVGAQISNTQVLPQQLRIPFPLLLQLFCRLYLLLISSSFLAPFPLVRIVFLAPSSRVDSPRTIHLWHQVYGAPGRTSRDPGWL
jgi:hypothetical protein